MRLFFIHVIFIFASFFQHPFFQLFYGATRTNMDRLASCASHSDSLIHWRSSVQIHSDFFFRDFRFFLPWLVHKKMPCLS